MEYTLDLQAMDASYIRSVSDNHLNAIVAKFFGDTVCFSWGDGQPHFITKEWDDLPDHCFSARNRRIVEDWLIAQLREDG